MGLTRPRLGQFQTTTAAFDDPLVVFNNNATGSNTKDIGIVFERGDDQNKVLIWDESADEFVLANSTEQGSTNGDVSLATYAPLQVAGLKASSLTLNGTAITATAAELNHLDGVTGITLGTANELLLVGGDGSSIVSDSTLAVDTSNNRLGINQSSPDVTLHMTGEGAQTAQIRMEQYNDSADAPDLRTRRYRGTIASPSAVSSGDYLYRSNHEYWNGSSLIVGGTFAFDNTNNANRTQFAVSVTTDGTSADANTPSKVQFKIDGNDSGAITFNNAYKFPTSDGSANQVLETDGSGTLSWTDVATTLDEVTANGNTTTNSISVGTITASGNIIPSAADTYSLGTPTLRFSELYVSNNTIYIGDTALSIVSGSLYVDGAPVVNQGDAYPGYDGDYDMAKALAQTTAETPFESGGQDAFGVDLSLVFDNMEPSGQTITYDFADEYSGGSAEGSPESYLGA